MNNEQTIREIHLCLYYKEQGESRAEIARITGLSPALVKTRLGQVKSALFMNLLPHPELVSDFPLENKRLRQEEVQAQIDSDRTAEANRASRELIRSEYVGSRLLESMTKLLPPCPRVPKAKLRKQGETVGVVISDAHVGKKSDRFNYQMALGCISHMMQTGLEEAITREAGELVFALLGDILDGYGIYKTQIAEVELTATEQFTVVLQCIADELFRARSEFDGKITVVGVGGNHGRVSTPEHATWENFERLMYDTLKLWFRDTDINFVTPPKEEFHVIHNDVFFFHGHEISGGGTLDGILQRCRNWLTLYGGKWKLSICGHFHRAMSGMYPQNIWHLVNGTASIEDMFIQRLGSSHSHYWWLWVQDEDNNPIEFIPIPLYGEDVT